MMYVCFVRDTVCLKSVLNYEKYFMKLHVVAEWLRHDATNWKVACLIPDEVIF
jgi:hypothetical protein